MKITPENVKYADKNKYLYALCFVRLLQDIALNYGYEDIAELIGSEYCFYQIERDSGITWYRHSMNPLDLLAREYGFTINSLQFSDLAAGIQHITDNLEKGILSMLEIDIFYLPLSSQYYQKMHREHYITITGVFPEKQVVTIIDSAKGLYNAEISYTVLEEISYSNNAGFNIQFNCIDVIPPNKPVRLAKDKFFALMCDNVKNMLKPDITLADQVAKSELGEFNRMIGGVEGLARLSESVERLISIGEENTVAVYHLLGIVPEHLELHSLYLKSVAKQFDLPECLVLSEMVFDIMQNWAVLRNMILKASMRDSGEFLKRCIERCKLIEELERKYICKLQETLQHYEVNICI